MPLCCDWYGIVSTAQNKVAVPGAFRENKVLGGGAQSRGLKTPFELRNLAISVVIGQSDCFG